ncbi:MBL fold metallo-hydrolase [Agrobacterium deltaense]|uniref:MBL fold metallo-hydrolase n=1 Tax=Agrobacterium deltaense TaxID=1183412 RepID=UPI0009BA3849|nr:MBL fold metallo-hydrolase [Agrobacterium deltaense]CUX10237.1 conserved hypothetical protein [Agrobacterium deltaense RV3]
MDKNQLRWVYDCGSNQVDALIREVGSVASGGDIDLLFLSHFDSDHVNGVDLLLSQVKVRQVVLPYLDEEAVVAIIARDAARGSLTGVFVEAASDLPRWFGSRGVETVTFIEYSDDDGVEGPDVPGAPDGGDEGDITLKWTGGKEPILASGTTAQTGEGTAQLQRVSPGAALVFTTWGGLLNWVLVPYAHKPSATLMKAFNDALDAEFGKSMDKKTIAQMAKDPAIRARLRNCYDELWANHNLISMTLYCGPIKPEKMNIEICTFKQHSYWDGTHAWFAGGGWMLTGDAHFDGLRRRQRFLKFYQRFLGLTNVLMLPHHGSIHNHSNELLNAMPKLRVGFAAAGPNNYGHPHNAVRYAVRAQPHAIFHQVDERQFRQIVMKVTKR